MTTPITNITELVQALTCYQLVRCLDSNGTEVAGYHINNDRDRYTVYCHTHGPMYRQCDQLRLPDIVKQFNRRTTKWVIGWD